MQMAVLNCIFFIVIQHKGVKNFRIKQIAKMYIHFHPKRKKFHDEYYLYSENDNYLLVQTKDNWRLYNFNFC